jgi:hypothetical protein
MLPRIMADLEELAVKRDRGYLVRLILSLAVAIVVCMFLFRAMTGEATSGCVASSLFGAEPKSSETPRQAPVDVP